MNSQLQTDLNNISSILTQTLAEAEAFLAGLANRPPGVDVSAPEPDSLPDEGLGAEKTLALFQQKYSPHLSASAGPRYFGFVTGGTTPAALAGDWLTGVYDQNLSSFGDSIAPFIELETINLLRTLFGLPDSFSGAFVSGATMANFVGLALGRQWVAHQQGIDIAQSGLYGLPPIKILSAAPHSSILKALSMLGMGKQNVQTIAALPQREALDVTALETHLRQLKGQPCIVSASAGTVNTVDFDDLAQIAALRDKYPFWLHVDGAFGGFAACSPKFQHLLNGLEQADSITIDAHKWLNVPYDSAMQFTRHQDLQLEVFQNSAAYLGDIGERPDFVHLTPENSRRFRALPAWFSLIAYGKQGYQDIVERNCAMAQHLSAKIAQSSQFELLAPTRLNVVCFTVSGADATEIKAFLRRLRADGRVFMTPTVYQDRPGIRAAISNWRTETNDIDLAWQGMLSALR